MRRKKKKKDRPEIEDLDERIRILLWEKYGDTLNKLENEVEERLRYKIGEAYFPPRITISSELSNLLKQGIIDKQIVDLGMNIVRTILKSIDDPVVIDSIVFSAYNPLDDFEYEDWIPYLEIKTKIGSSEELLELWDKVLEVLKNNFSQEDLEKICVFLRR